MDHKLSVIIVIVAFLAGSSLNVSVKLAHIRSAVDNMPTLTDITLLKEQVRNTCK